ncbi:hypothetical protein OG352_13480 [Streptomyces sp. NBC_01485]|uniref:hypothetical protein n=1 Tax=Streptomyces sp. NBC_01485 TaxID=2903884 RepID=UPI002E2F1F4C|nr:hypothetical protein [Streptomyces sp. NBC_01485]
MLITDAAVREAAAHLAQSLGGEWAIDAEAPADGAAHLLCSDGRGISFRPIFGGTTVQLWITGSAAPPPPDSATLADHALYEAQVTARLPEGHRYNKATTLVTEADEDPELIILRILEDDLLPAFDYKPRYVGHRPWIALFDNALAAVAAEREAPLALDGHDQDLEESAPQELDAAPEEPPSPEAVSDIEVAPEPTREGADIGMEDQPAPEPSPALGRRPRRRSPKRPATATATEPES